MKIFFIADRRDTARFDIYEKVINSFTQNGDSVDRSWVDRTSDQDAQDFENAFKRNMRSVKNADVIVAEVSELSSGVGFLISTAMNQKKPVLALFNEDSPGIPSTTLRGSNNRLLIFTKYGEKNLEKIVKEFTNKVKNLLDTKFILIIPAEIDRYLEWASSAKRMHKAQLVREAIEKVIEDDKEYQDFLNSI